MASDADIMHATAPVFDIRGRSRATPGCDIDRREYTGHGKLPEAVASSWYHDDMAKRWVRADHLREMQCMPVYEGWRCTGKAGEKEYVGHGESPEAARLACIAAYNVERARE